MTFFPPDPELPEPEQHETTQPRWWSAPDDELPALYPVSEVLATTAHVAIALVGVAVHSDGIAFHVERRLRRNDLPAREWNELCATFMEHHPWGGQSHPADRLRFGVVFGDGERAIADHFPGFGGGDRSVAPEGYVLSRRGGGGGGGGSTYSGTDTLWLWPTPAPGPIELVMQWPAFGIGETRVVLDGTEMIALASHARPFWAEHTESEES